MKNKMGKGFCAILIALTAFFGVGRLEGRLLAAERGKQTVITHEGVADFGRGTSRIQIEGNDEQTLVGKEFHVYQLFTAENAVGGESIQYEFYPEYQNVLRTVVGRKLGKPAGEVTEYAAIDYIQSLHTNRVEGSQATQLPESSYSRFRYFIEELRNEMKQQNLTGDTVKVTSVKGGNVVELAGLSYGYYIVDEVTQVEGKDCAASLCMVNTANPSAEIQIKSDYPMIEKKIQEDDGRDVIGNLGWNDIGDYEIGQTVPYRFTSVIPNMNGYDTYYFAWHDRMDSALTLKPETVQIAIVDEETNRTYSLKKTEYTVTMSGTEQETFRTEIVDLKQIVDREFDRIGSTGENRYGQKITVTYEAYLNEQAAQDTGRPGFENDVKLEFSNNPDSDGRGSTGETPWDTVVCFTYKLNGIKINDHDRPLEGAKFRLYSDEACKEEVFVKKVSQGYCVINRDSVGGKDHTGGTAPAEAVAIESDKKGVFTIIGLDGGTYWLKETEAPAGYRPILDPMEITVKPFYTEQRNDYVKGQGATKDVLKKLEYSAKIRQFFSGILKDDHLSLKTDPEDGTGKLSVINRVGVKLPATGSHAMPILLLLGVGCILLAFVLQKIYETKKK